jgi:hypothetical protein
MGYSNIECGNVVVIAHPPFILRSPPKENARFPSPSNKTRVLLIDPFEQKYVTIKNKETHKQKRCQLIKSRGFNHSVWCGVRSKLG